jgi:uncharacterized protein YndB with AHSA1/START domain
MIRNQTISKDVAKRQLMVRRSFSASQERLWAAWSDGDILAKWWGPGDWPATTKSFDFRPGGHWHYKMTGPDGTESWSRIDYKTIDAPNSFTAEDCFCDPEGNKNPDMPTNQWHVEMTSTNPDGPTMLVTTLTFGTEADMQKIIDMGFEGGFSMALDQLEEQLATEK